MKIVPYDGGVGLSHLQNLFLCINEDEVHVLRYRLTRWLCVRSYKLTRVVLHNIFVILRPYSVARNAGIPTAMSQRVHPTASMLSRDMGMGGFYICHS